MTDDRPRTDDLEVTIDLAAAERTEPHSTEPDPLPEASETEPARRSRRRGLVVAVIVLLVAGVAGAGAWAAILAERGQGWQARAEAYELRAHALEHDLETALAARAESDRLLTELRGDLAATDELLATSEADVAALEGRVGDLANEKAQVEDERERVRDEAQVLSSVATLATSAGSDLDRCVADLTGWLASPPDGTAPAPVWDAWAAQGETISGRCATAQASFGELRAGLGG